MNSGYKIVRILGIPFKVFVVPGDIPSMKDGDLGMFTLGDCSIYIKPFMPVGQQEQVLLHEIIEAAVASTGIDIKHSYIQLISSLIYQVFKDNEMFDQARLNQLTSEEE